MIRQRVRDRNHERTVLMQRKVANLELCKVWDSSEVTLE